MITNLFSVFDPSTAIFSIAWIIMFLIPLLPASPLWNVSPILVNFYNKIIGTFNNEVSFTLNNSEKSVSLMIITAFFIIIIINFIALYPQNFSPTSHLTVTLPLSLLFWLTIVMFGWINNTNHILAHLVPQGTPSALIIFIVIIEMVSNIIRPITLCVRLTANLIAGHLLMSLLGNAIASLSVIPTFLSLPVPLALTVLEAAVACIQAYVFITLITLYTTETN